MISKFKKILFYADGAKGELAALQRAVRIAEVSGARLFVMDVVATVANENEKLSASIRKLQTALIRERGLVLDQLIAGVKPSKGRTAAIRKIVVPGKDYIEVIRTVIRDEFDCVIKAANSDSGLASVLLGNRDIKLLHFCPVPVLILKPSRRTSMRNILAAIDPVVGDRKAQKLNSNLMSTAISLAELEDADLHILHVLSKLPRSRQDRKHKDEMKELGKALKEDAERRMQRLLEDYEHVDLTDHLVTGDPEKEITKFCKAGDVDLLVMGSVARSGIPGLLVGNTAEKILHQVDCSIMTLKPPGWKSPVR